MAVHSPAGLKFGRGVPIPSPEVIHLMANAVNSASHAQQVAQAAQAVQAYQTNPSPRQNTTKAAAPQDTVTISPAAQAANQAAQSQQSGGKTD